MRICFSGLERPIDIEPSLPFVLEIENRVLFSRVIQSFLSEAGESAVEPYTLWSEAGKEIRPRGFAVFVANPFDLPWNDRVLMGEITSRLERIYREDEHIRSALEEVAQLLSSKVSFLAMQLQSDYAFEVDWDLRRYMKAFGFGVDFDDADALIDNLIKFMTLASDASLKKLIVFVNLKLFLSKNELERLYEQIFFSNLQVLFLENIRDMQYHEHEQKMNIDLDFLET